MLQLQLLIYIEKGQFIMGDRYADWLRQAEADLRHARNSLENGDYE